MATRKPPARGTTRRPAKATTAVSKTRSAAKKPLKVAAKAETPETESTIVPLPTKGVAAVEAEIDTVLEPLVDIDEPATAQPAAKPETTESVEPAVSAPVEQVESVEAAEPQAATKPHGAPFATMFLGMPEFPAFPSFGMDAFIASGNAVVEGAQSFGDELMAYSQHAFERNVQTTMALLTATSLDQVIELQSRYTMGSVDDLLQQGAKFTGMAITVANKAASPFTRG